MIFGNLRKDYRCLSVIQFRMTDDGIYHLLITYLYSIMKILLIWNLI